MPEPTLESPASLGEQDRPAPAVIPPTRDWQSVVGLFDGSEFSRQVDAEVEAVRAAERRPGDGEAGA